MSTKAWRTALLAAALLWLLIAAVWLLWHWLIVAAVGVVAWRVLMQQAGLRKRGGARSGRSVWEVAAGFATGWWAARHSEDVVRSAVRHGGEIQIHVTPGSRYRR